MILQVYCLCVTLLLVTMDRTDEISAVTLFRKCTQEEACDTPLAECAPCGILQSFAKCLQLSSCSFVRFNPKALTGRMCLASNYGSSAKPSNSTSNEEWVCRSKASSDSCFECQPGSKSIKSRSGERKCVQYDQQQPQGIRKMYVQSARNAHLLSTTKQDLKDNWRTSKMQDQDIMISLTWSPLFANDFYILSKDGFNYNIKLFKFNGNSLKKQVTWDNVPLPVTDKSEIWKVIDTGQCLTNDDMACIYALKETKQNGLVKLHLRSYREAKCPRRLYLEKEGDIESRFNAGWSSFYFYNNIKFGMSLYNGGLFTKTKYNIQVGENGFTLIVSENIIGLRWAMDIKYDKNGSFAFAISSKHMYLIRYFDNKEKVIFSANHNWEGYLIPFWADTSLLVLGTDEKEFKAISLKIHDF